MLATFVIASRTPRVWGQLTPGEVDRIELLLKAGAVA